jgi:hypothetical protein
MSKFKACNEAIFTLGDGLYLDRKETTFLACLFYLVLDNARCHLFSVLFSLPDYVLSGVTDTASGASPTRRLAARDGFKRYFANIAEDLMSNNFTH